MFIVDNVVEEDPSRRMLLVNELEDLCSRADRERTHGLTSSSARCASPPLYLSEICIPAVVLKSLSWSQHSEPLLLLQNHLFTLLLKTLSERSALPFALHGTRVVFLLLKQFSSEPETEAEVILALLVQLISGETDAGEPWPGWMRVLAIEIMRW
jgi:Guanine nucleotide exchange factor in Golgi transport N-terminal